MMEREKKRVLSFSWIWRTIDQDKTGLREPGKRFPLAHDVKGLDRAKPIPAARQGNDFRIILVPFCHGVLELFGPAEPVGRILDACGGRNRAAQRMSGMPGTKLKRTASRGQECRHFFQKAAAQWRENPGGRIGGLRLGVIFFNQSLKLTFERIGISDNPSELLSAFRGARAVSARF